MLSVFVFTQSAMVYYLQFTLQIITSLQRYKHFLEYANFPVLSTLPHPATCNSPFSHLILIRLLISPKRRCCETKLPSQPGFMVKYTYCFLFHSPVLYGDDCGNIDISNTKKLPDLRQTVFFLSCIASDYSAGASSAAGASSVASASAATAS